MNQFNFSETAGASQNTSRPKLKGNQVHEVTFEGVEKKEVEGKQAHNMGTIYKMLEIKFTNEDGYYTESFFEPKEADFTDRDGTYGPTPSNVKSMMLYFKHLIDDVNPTLAKQIDAGEKNLNATSWDALRDLIVKATEPGKGKATKIKLINSNKGEARTPYFAAYSKEGKLYMKSNFIGDKIFFNDKELEQIKKAAMAKPTNVTNDMTLGTASETVGMDSSMNFDL